MTKKWRLVLVLLVMMMALTGCVQMDLHVTVNLDGSGVYQWKFLTNSYLQSYLQQAETAYTSKGYQTKSIQENGNVGFVATKNVKSIADEPLSKEFNSNANTASLLLNQMASNDSLYPTAGSSTGNFQDKLKIESNFLTTTFVFHTNADMTKVLGNAGDKYSSYTNSLLGQLKMRFLLTLPITPSEHNANEVTDDGKTLIWNLQIGKSNPIQVGIQLPTPIVLVIAAFNGQANQIPHFGAYALGWAIIILVVVILLIMLIRRFFGRKKPPTGGDNNHLQDPNQTQLDGTFK